MIDAPERIWAWDETGETCELMGHKEGEWTTEDCSDTAISATEYVHADLHDATKAQLAKAVEALIDTTANLVAALSLLERGGKKAAPSNKMFDQMIRDYNAGINRSRAVLAEIEKGGA